MLIYFPCSQIGYCDDKIGYGQANSPLYWIAAFPFPVPLLSIPYSKVEAIKKPTKTHQQ
jgi:hypothetical protein